MDYKKFQTLYNKREKDFLLHGTPKEWEQHLRSLGVRRMETDFDRCKAFIWSAALKDWLRVPAETFDRAMVLGFLP